MMKNVISPNKSYKGGKHSHVLSTLQWFSMVIGHALAVGYLEKCIGF